MKWWYAGIVAAETEKGIYWNVLVFLSLKIDTIIFFGTIERTYMEIFAIGIVN